MHTTDSPMAILALRLAAPEDAAAIDRLAVLDSATTPTGPLLLGVVDGTPRAALSLTTGDAVADPFTRTQELLELLRHRAASISAGRGPRLGLATGRFRRA